MTPTKWEESLMTTQPSVHLRGENVVLELPGANGAPVSLELNRHQALAMIGAILQAINALPTDQTTPLHLQKAFLKAKHPSFQVGIAPDGDVVLAIMPAPFPSIEFLFDAQGLDKLIADLRKAANVPSQPHGSSH
jgi:hypothetical protein